MIDGWAIYSKFAHRWMSLDLTDEHAECHRTLLMVNQHWFRQWLGAVRQQAITRANVDQDPCRHLTSLDHNELICYLTDSSWLMVTSSTLALKCGIHGGSTTGNDGRPMVGDGRTKSMLGGGTWNDIYKCQDMYARYVPLGTSNSSNYCICATSH